MKCACVELLPGLQVAAGDYRPEGGSDGMPDSFVCEGRFLRFNVHLYGGIDLRVHRQNWGMRAGELHLVAGAGERFRVSECHGISNVEVLIAPHLLPDLLGEQLLSRVPQLEQLKVLSGRASPQVMLLAKELHADVMRGSYARLLLQAKALELLHWHLEACLSLEPASAGLSARERQQLQRARERLLSDWSSPPTIAELAREVGMNQCRLKQAYKQHYGQGVYASFLQARMQFARQLLRHKSVTETAIEVGYSNVSHFSAAFRKQFGVLPGGWQKKSA